ncbi:MAG: PEP/pyruvate-binding domain-containing protein [Sphaerochaetaceae bacterium]|nr:PEP/pyruvate-binding domain-containing protein [Sphaerochaetaceae bacterium]
MYKLDQTWLPFSNLMLQHIYNILLICSDYDRFLIEEDGRVEEELYLEYTQLGLTNPPKITHAASPTEALSLLEERKFDLVITMLDLGTEHVEELATQIKELKPDMPVVVMSPSPTHRRNKLIKGSMNSAIDYFFYWQGNPSIFLAMAKLIEDRMNLDHDTAEADVQVIILVEDSVRFYSSFLPLMYTSLILQNRSSILEALNNWGRTLRMRGRPKILLARTYEDAVSLYETYRHNILGIITDVSYSRDGEDDPEAGLRLCRLVHDKDPDLPILVQSTKESYREMANDAGAAFIWKLSSSLLTDLHKYLVANYGFGPFIFRNPETGEELARAETMRDLQRILPEIPNTSFISHARRNDFSRWLRAKSLYVLAAKIKPLKEKDFDTPEIFQEKMVEIIKTYRTERTKGIITQFNRDNYDETLFFCRIGSGSLGGKGRGLAFIDMELRASDILENYPDIYLSIPRTVVIATDLFTRFIEENQLQEVAFADIADENLLRVFLACPLPGELSMDLAEILKVIHQPITVRSSSLLEDSHFQPFAGVYETCMIPNQGSDAQRLAELSDAVKCVWASTYFRRAKEYLRATDHMLEEEKMAVVIQQVIGSEHGDYWYPNISGVARSLNYYPLGGETPEDGVGMLSFGFGKSVVDNGSAFRFSPRHPRRPVQFLGGTESSSQTHFYGLRLGTGYHPLDVSPENLELLPLSEAEAHPDSLKYVASTYDNETGQLSESIRAVGRKVITFNGVLKYDAFPLAAIVRDILRLGTGAMSTPIEIEFAVNLNRKAPKKPEFSLLQIRPIVEGNEESDIVVDDSVKERAFVYSRQVMGNGKIDTIRDIIYLKTDRFNPSHTAEMAAELDKLNAPMVLNQADYALIVAGRLGSCDPWLGIPVSWSQISRAQVIVETGLPNFQVEPSQGTHFFQNLTSLGNIYMTVNPSYNDGRCDFSTLDGLPLVEETEFFRHVRTELPLDIRVNGFKGEGVMAAGVPKERKEEVEKLEGEECE